MDLRILIMMGLHWFNSHQPLHLQLRKFSLYIPVLRVQLSQEVRRLFPSKGRVCIGIFSLLKYKLFRMRNNLGGTYQVFNLGGTTAGCWFCICFIWARAASNSSASTELSCKRMYIVSRPHRIELLEFNDLVVVVVQFVLGSNLCKEAQFIFLLFCIFFHREELTL